MELIWRTSNSNTSRRCWRQAAAIASSCAASSRTSSSSRPRCARTTAGRSAASSSSTGRSNRCSRCNRRGTDTLTRTVVRTRRWCCRRTYCARAQTGCTSPRTTHSRTSSSYCPLRRVRGRVSWLRCEISTRCCPRRPRRICEPPSATRRTTTTTWWRVPRASHCAAPSRCAASPPRRAVSVAATSSVSISNPTSSWRRLRPSLAGSAPSARCPRAHTSCAWTAGRRTCSSPCPQMRPKSKCSPTEPLLTSM